MDSQSLLSARRIAGVILKDWWRYERALIRSNSSYLALCNRYEHLEPAPEGRGFRCDWQWTSDLAAPQHLPLLGLRLMRRALATDPVRLAPRPVAVPSQPAQVSFIIGHRGASRLPHLLTTLQSIAAQSGPAFECIVVEQDMQPQLPQHLPPWVRYLHSPPPDPAMAYCRSWTFNVGARCASGRVLVLHDNDMLVPDNYAANVLTHVNQGYELVNLKRFIFYLSQAHTLAVFDGNAELTAASPQAITQNSQGGASIAITREAYDRIGGMDESFIGWGGEDNEFWERAQTLRVWPYAYLPLVHLWHPAQPGKHQADNPTLAHYRQLSAIAPQERIRRLRETPSGQLSGPAGWVPPSP